MSPRKIVIGLLAMLLAAATWTSTACPCWWADERVHCESERTARHRVVPHRAWLRRADPGHRWRRRPASGSLSQPASVELDQATEVRLTWLIHDVTVWRTDGIYITRSDGVWVNTLIDPNPGSGTFDQPAAGTGPRTTRRCCSFSRAQAFLPPARLLGWTPLRRHRPQRPPQPQPAHRNCPSFPLRSSPWWLGYRARAWRLDQEGEG